MKTILPAFVTLLGSLAVGPAPAAPGLEIQPVTDNVYALVGSLDNRSPENLGNNATFGAVVTGEGVVLIDSGGTRRGAQQIHAALARITDQPVVLVINTGGQDHRWLGNDYFKELGAEILASRRAVEDQRARTRDQLILLANLVGAPVLEGTDPLYADRVFDSELRFEVGGTTFELHHPGPAHTPGDSFVWLPAQRVLFAGDIVYTERMLSIGAHSDSRGWVAAYRAMAALRPEHVVPGHGHATTLERAAADTLGYLTFLRQAVAAFMENGGDIADIGTIDQSRYDYLANADALAGRNAQQVFTELEWE
jgi:glyoxylase-like metal-dependent hydrolase (beta-lactamase superfamily II)